ncbi:MAG TPA: succinylglutamate desuccinylase/aspartoacylase family protein [Alphaproteobacteria bacterium]|jgi:predicted deacylase|nr:succinylglutamate desuccinylase/aspartoacylase family protein [Alphaproteobacteria bacterium]
MNDAASQSPIEVVPRDLSVYRNGNTGIDYVHRFDSGSPGPAVLAVALTHGNEFCGMTALSWLLDHDVRPKRGALTLAFANVAAYERFDPGRPFESRFVDRDLNRAWTDAIMADDTKSIEARRARELRPVVDAADALIDLHSTAFPCASMLVLGDLEKSRRLATALREPLTHIISPAGKHQGGLLFEYGRFGRENDDAVAIAVECGQHFARRSGEVAIQAALRFLRHFDVIDRAFAERHLEPPTDGEPTTYRITEVVTVKGEGARFARPLVGFEEFAKGELIGFDGVAEVRAPYDRCAAIMPRAVIVPGREMVSLGRRL